MARKKKKGPTPSAKKKKKKKVNPLLELMKAHPHLSKEQARDILESGLSVEEWEAREAAAKEARRRDKQERMARLLCTQNPKLSFEQAMECVQQNLTPDEYFAQLRKKARAQKKAQFKKRGKGRGGPKKKAINNKQALRRKQIDQLLEQHPELTRAIAGQIVSGNITYEQYISNKERRESKKQTHRTPEEIERARELRIKRKLQLEERVAREAHLGHLGDAYLQGLMEEQVHVEILRFHAPSFDGQIIAVEPFLIFLKTSSQPKLKLIKRYCALLYKKEEQAQIYSQLQIAPYQFALRQYPHREPKKRYQVPEEYLVDGEKLTVLLHNGLLITGTISWSDRFQLLLQLPEGGELFIFRHAIHRASNDLLEPEGGSLALAEFFSSQPELPQPHPQTLPPQEIEVPTNFNDFDVKDVIYEKYLKEFEEGTFELQPISVRRESDSYVLIDGYRRLTLAIEKSIKDVPIVVV